MTISLDAIGILRTPHQTAEGAPIQPRAAQGVAGVAEMSEDLIPALRDLDGFSHLILLYHFHQATRVALEVLPYMDHVCHGVLATRAPVRPNHLGLSIVRLVRIDGARLYLLDVDMLDGSPLLDVKPYVPAFDQPSGPVRVGWLEGRLAALPDKRADERFI